MKYFFLFLVFGFLNCIQGQVGMELSPASETGGLSEDFDYLIIQPDHTFNLNSREQQNPLFAGYTVELQDMIEQIGSWVTMNNLHVWRVGLTVKDAKALNVYLESLALKEEEFLFVYNPGKENLLGAFTKSSNKKHFGTGFLPGDSIIIELNTPYLLSELPFDINEVGVSVNPFGTGSRDFGDSGPCEVLVNCPEGKDVQDEKRGVARILVKEGSSLFWCSGSLVNNTNRDGTPYFLTAHHCGEDASAVDYSQWVFYFNFESVNCEMPAVEPEYQSISGATLLADGKRTSIGSDFKLLLLQEGIPDSYRPYFNGWSRSETPSSNGVGIHHPDGDLKMVSTYTEPLFSSNYNNPTPDENGRFWHVVWSATESGHGVTEGGSSGSPIFDPEGYIVGTLSGGRASCSNLTQPDYYGKFSVHWEDNGNDSTEQLKYWLDPKGTDIPALRGLDMDTSGIKADFDSYNTNIKVGGNVQFNNKSQGEIIDYTWEFPGGDPEFAESQTPPPVYYYKTGEYDVKLTVKSDSDVDSLRIKNYVRVLPNVFPNPSVDGKYNIIFGDQVPADLELRVFDAQGRNISYRLNTANENTLIVDLGIHPQGIYLINITYGGVTQLVKVGNKILSLEN